MLIRRLQLFPFCWCPIWGGRNKAPMASIIQHCAFLSWSFVHCAWPRLSKKIDTGTRGLQIPECLKVDDRSVRNRGQGDHGNDLLASRSSRFSPWCSTSVIRLTRPSATCQARVRTVGSVCILVDRIKQSMHTT